MTTLIINRFGAYSLARRGYRFIRNKLRSVRSKARLLLLRNTLRKPIAAPVAAEVEAYYDRETEAYLGTYGEIIQSARPSSDADLITYFAESMGIRDGMRVLDAGCGVCGPAVGLAKMHAITVEAITISEVQVTKSRQYVAENGLESRIRVTKGDFADLTELYPANSFDLVYFLETLGYANDLRAVLQGVARMLKQGGSVYVKDFFLVPILDIEKREVQQDYTRRIRDQYLYRIPDLNQLITLFREIGFFIELVRPMNITEDFTRAALFETVNKAHTVYTKAIHTPFQLFESLELKFRKVYP